MNPKFENEVSIKLISGETGEVKYDSTQENAISDDFLCPYAAIYTQITHNQAPYCFILPDGPNWSGFTFDRMNPYAPYSVAVNNYVNNGADPQWKAYNGVGGYTGPYGVLGQTKLFFQWTNLPNDFQLRAIGLTGWQSYQLGGDTPDTIYGAGFSPTVNLTPTVLVPQTLVVLPSAILIHGILPGGIPDILQISYFLSIVGVS
jgi:hypothetical protein